MARPAPDRILPRVKLPGEIFRTYDIRGVVGKSLTPAIVREIGRALGSLGRERNAATFAVCRDGRLSGPELSAALIEGLLSAGANAIDVGMRPTPIAYFAAHHLDCGSCVAVSGSHNPPQYNGLKMVVAGTTLFGDEIQALRTRAERGELKSEAAFHAKVAGGDAVVQRRRHLDDAVVLHVQLEHAAHAAVGAHRLGHGLP